jgi:membrane associated rhomboid family serine protease
VTLSNPNPDADTGVKVNLETMVTAFRFVPVTVGAVAVLGWMLVTNGVQYTDLFTYGRFDPFRYLARMLFHTDFEHFLGNLRLWVAFGVVFTFLTNNRHVLGVVVVAEFLATVVGTGVGVGLSGAVLAVAGALLVQATAMAVGDVPTGTLLAAFIGAFVPVAVAFLSLAVFVGGAGNVDHFAHFYGLMFGGATEAVVVLAGHDPDGDGGGPTID